MVDKPPDDRLIQRNVPQRIKTFCPDCEGRGAKLVPRMGIIDGEPAYLGQAQRCKNCDGTGRLDGFQPPV